MTRAEQDAAVPTTAAQATAGCSKDEGPAVDSPRRLGAAGCEQGRRAGPAVDSRRCAVDRGVQEGCSDRVELLRATLPAVGPIAAVGPTAFATPAVVGACFFVVSGRSKTRPAAARASLRSSLDDLPRARGRAPVPSPCLVSSAFPVREAPQGPSRRRSSLHRRARLALSAYPVLKEEALYIHGVDDGIELGQELSPVMYASSPQSSRPRASRAAASVARRRLPGRSGDEAETSDTPTDCVCRTSAAARRSARLPKCDDRARSRARRDQDHREFRHGRVVLCGRAEISASVRGNSHGPATCHAFELLGSEGGIREINDATSRRPGKGQSRLSS